MSGEKRSIAFRLFGDFHWPPTGLDLDDPADDATVAQRLQGVAEIHYVEFEAGKPVAVLRFVPRSGEATWTPFSDDLSGTPHIHDLADADLHVRLEQKLPVRLDRPGAKPPHTGLRLVFRGGTLLDQFSREGNDSSGEKLPPPDRRLLLSRRFSSQGGKQSYSELVVGFGKSDDVWRLNIALPTPNIQSGTAGDPTYAVSFAAIYNPVLPGWSSGPVDIGKAVTWPVSSLAITLHSGKKSLGAFGFAKNSSNEKDGAFGALPQQPTFWVSDDATLSQTLLGKLGFPNTLKTAYVGVSLSHRRRFSVRFGADDADRTRTILLVRQGIDVDNGWLSHPPGDVTDAGELGYIQHELSLRVPQMGGWLDLGEELTIEFEHSYRIDDSEIWKLGGTTAAIADHSLDVRLGFSQAQKSDSTEVTPQGGEPSVGPLGLLQHAFNSMHVARFGLQDIEATTPDAMLGDIRIGPDVSAQFALTARLGVGLAENNVLDWGHGARPLYQLSLWPADRTLRDDGATSIGATLRLPAFDETGGLLPIQIVREPTPYTRSRPIRFLIAPAADSSTNILGRLGGLQLRLSKAAIETNSPGAETSHLWFAWRGLQTSRIARDKGAAALALADLEFRLRLKVDQVRQIGVDVPLPGRTSPLLIPASEDSGEGAFLLDATETISGAEDRHLKANLIDHAVKAASAPDSYVLLSEQPFSIARFASTSLQNRGDAGNSIVAVYDSLERGWQLKRDTDIYQYELPPQAVGESMDKPRRLAIVDPEPLDPGFPKGELPPARPAYAPPGGQGIEPGAEARHVVSYRLTPSAEIWVRPSDVEHGYLLPEWSAQQMFRQRGELGLGVALKGLRAEFLYGLAVGVNPALETGNSRGARLAEIEALTGRLPGPLADAAGQEEKAYHDRWSALSETLATRPERLEIWAADPSAQMPLAPAGFSRGASFAFRGNALHRPPLKGVAAPDDSLIRTAEHGLSGGALWPLESKNFFNVIAGDPRSSGGAIERIALSPTGGDADQRAEFLGGIVRIVSETRNGYVQRHRVEILGRIAVFWHPARHVVVYERTVNPSAQFTPKDGIGQRTRRPVLRKVSEYIEPIDIDRVYPDFPVGQENAGFLRRVVFNQPTINVDSAWGEDVGDFGWKIPLWNRASAKERPQVYPRPDLAFFTAAEGAAAQSTVAQECLDPDNVYFFADAKAGTADTNAWASRVGIDWTNLPAASHDQQQVLDGEPTAGMPGASARRIPRGHRRFTWRLAPPARRTTINAGRGADPIYAGLETITFMRSTPAPKTVLGAKISDALKNAANLGEAPTGGPAYWPVGGQPDQDAQTLVDLAGKLDAFVKADSTTAIQAAGELQTELNTFRSNVQNDRKLGPAIKQAKELKDKLAGIGKLVDEAPKRCEQLIGDFVGSIKRKQLMVLEQVRSWEGTPDRWLDAVPDGQTLAQYVADEVKKAVEPVLDDMARDVGDVRNGIEAASQIARDVQSDIEAAIAKARSDLAAMRTSYDRGKPWSAQRLAEFDKVVGTAQARAIAEIGAAAAEAQHRLRTELDQMAQLVASEAGDALARLGGAQSELKGAIGAGGATAQRFLDLVVRKLDLLIDKLPAIQTKLDEAIAKAPKYAATLEGIKQRLAQIAVAAAAVRDACAAASSAAGTTVAAVQAAIGTAASTCSGLIAQASEDVRLSLAELAMISEAELQDLRDELVAAVGQVSTLAAVLRSVALDIGGVVDGLVDAAIKSLDDAARDDVPKAIAPVLAATQRAAEELDTQLEALGEALGPKAAAETIANWVITPAIDELLAGYEVRDITDGVRDELDRRLGRLSETIEGKINALASKAVDADTIRMAQRVCGAIGSSIDDLKGFFDDLEGHLDERVRKLVKALDDAVKDAKQLVELQKLISADVRRLGNDISSFHANANAYVDRVAEAVGHLDDGGLAAAPSNILKLYAAAATAPALPNLEFARDRLAYYYGRVNDIVDTTPAEAWFGRLGDELKAMGISLPFEQLGARLLPGDLSNVDISRVFRNFGGINLDKLLRGYKLPAGAKDVIKLTHAFDKAQFRAWVQVDVNLPVDGRKSLFSIGAFQLDLVNSRLMGTVRLEASKDSDRVEQSGRAVLGTNIEAVVAGQTMVTLSNVAIRYEKSSGLKVDLDPKQIKLNAVFRFIQETLGTLFPEEIGGLRLIKQGGIPVGVEHEFAMPPVSLMYATSGVSNIFISNHFSLIAYPDFVIADRFSLSRPERPFLFSIFILGGTGYITVETEYRPFRNELMVMVEAAAGASASVGFAFGPVSGQVYITLSIALGYRKLIGRPGGGLTVSLVLLVAGNVDVAGIVTVYIGLLLRINYRDNGEMDATGTLTVSIRISRFFKISVRANARYKLRGGRSQTTSQISKDATITDPKLAAATDKAKQLLKARG